MKIHTYEGLLPEWLRGLTVIKGAEGEDDGGDSSDSGNGDADDDGAEGHEDSEGSSDGSQDDDKHDVTGLKSALEAERKANRRKDKELARLQRQEQERKDAEKGEVEAERAKRERAEAKAEKLALGYRNSALDREIEKAAREAKFIDVDDALAGVDRSAITVDQDEDDPSDVEIDIKAVQKAVKAYATKKPHLVRTGTDDGERTGSTFGGAGRRRQQPTQEEELRSKYPALNY